MEYFESYKTFLILQVLSRTTASGLESQGRHDTRGTVKLFRMIDTVLDCNLDRAWNPFQQKKKRKTRLQGV